MRPRPHTVSPLPPVGHLACYKKPFPSAREARAVRRKGHGLRVYRCTDCGAWHLTSQPYRPGVGRAFGGRGS